MTFASRVVQKFSEIPPSTKTRSTILFETVETKEEKKKRQKNTGDVLCIFIPVLVVILVVIFLWIVG